MYNLCTLSDEKYLLKGLVLYDSLVKKNDDFILHYLCLDQKTYDILIDLNLNKMKLYNIIDLLKTDKELEDTRLKREYNYFCWSLASYFCKYLLNNEIEQILYIDSDIIFYHPVDGIYDEIGNKSIGIIRHRHVPRGHKVGEFNVGIIYFRGDEKGKECCNFWWELVSGKDTRFPEYATCGDQKYLELFPIYYEEYLCIIDEIGHAAPYNFSLYQYNNFDMIDKKIIFNGKQQKIIFYHFMKFKPYFHINKYDTTDEPLFPAPIHIRPVKLLYDEYYEINKTTYYKYFKK